MSAGTKFIRFSSPSVAAIREFGGSSQSVEVLDRVTEMFAIGDDERAERTATGTLRVADQVNRLGWTSQAGVCVS